MKWGVKLFQAIRFETVKEEDRDKINKLTENTWVWGDYTPECFDRWVKDGLFIKAVSDGEILGIIHVRLFDDFAWFEGIRVKQEIRRKGVGKSLAKKAMEMSNRKVFRLAANEKNVPSVQLARTLGFKEIDRFYYISEGKYYETDQLIKEYRLREINEQLDIKGYVDDWVWLPFEKYKGKIYSNGEITMLKTSPPFLVKGYIEGVKHITKNFVSNSEEYIVFELKLSI